MPKRVTVYARQSKTDADRVPSTQWQVEQCRAECARRRWTVAGVYADANLSGYRDVHRPEFERLLSDLAGGVDVVMAWSVDRLTRKGVWGRDTVELLRGLHDSGIVLVTLDEDYDTSTARGKRRLADDLSRAEEESERISRRSRAGKEASAARGDPKHGGPRPLGWRIVPGDGGRRVELVGSEADLIRQAADAVLAGSSLRSVVLDWQRRGIRTTTGRAWSTQGLRGLLLQPRLVGDRVHRGEVIVGDAYPPVLDRAIWESVGAELRDASRTMARPVRTYLLTGLVRCTACGGRMRANQPAGGPRRYVCPPKPEGCNGRAILADPLEAMIGAGVLDALAGPGMASALSAAPVSVASPDPAADLRDAEARRDALARERARGEIDQREWAVMRAELQRIVDDARSRLARVRRPALARWMGRDLPAWWADEGTTVEDRRQLVAAVVERIEIGPALRGRQRFDPERVLVEWRA